MNVKKTELYIVTSDDEQQSIAVEQDELFNILELRKQGGDVVGESWPFCNEAEMADFKKKHDDGCKRNYWFMYHAYVNENGRIWSTQI